MYPTARSSDICAIDVTSFISTRSAIDDPKEKGLSKRVNCDTRCRADCSHQHGCDNQEDFAVAHQTVCPLSEEGLFTQHDRYHDGAGKKTYLHQ